MKKVLSIILALAFIIPCAVFASAETRLLGDVDGDGKVDVADYAMIKCAVLKSFDLDEAQKLIADVDKSGDIDAIDYAMVKRAVLGTFELDGTVQIDGPAAQVESDDGLLFELNQDRISYRVKGLGTYNSNNVVIPDEVNGLPVTAIGDRAFLDRTNIKSVTIPLGVTSIGAHAFNGCYNLSSIDIPNGVDFIDGSAFAHCVSLKSITLPESIIEIGASAFLYCEKLSAIELSESLKSIGSSAFKGCYRITSIKIPENVESIGETVFAYCDKLADLTVDENNKVYHSSGSCIIETASKTLITGTNYSVIPDDGSVTSIARRAFYGLDKLTKITIPDGVTTIGESAFEDCTKLANVELPDSITKIYRNAFNGTVLSEKSASEAFYIGRYLIRFSNDRVTQYAVKDGTKLIANSAFSGQEKLIAVEIPESVEYIGDYAFGTCRRLQRVTIPKNVKDIGEGILSGCIDPVLIKVDESNQRYHSAGQCIIETASKTVISGQHNSVIPADGSVEIIGRGSFSGCVGVTFMDIIIPEGITTIEDTAFRNSCLTNIVIPSSVTFIGENAFANCASLKNINYAGTEQQWNSIKTGGDTGIDVKNVTFNYKP